jgi:hypothetical protein
MGCYLVKKLDLLDLSFEIVPYFLAGHQGIVLFGVPFGLFGQAGQAVVKLVGRY